MYLKTHENSCVNAVMCKLTFKFLLTFLLTNKRLFFPSQITSLINVSINVCSTGWLLGMILPLSRNCARNADSESLKSTKQYPAGSLKNTQLHIQQKWQMIGIHHNRPNKFLHININVQCWNSDAIIEMTGTYLSSGYFLPTSLLISLSCPYIFTKSSSSPVLGRQRVLTLY